jgi:hypothetical protein
MKSFSLNQRNAGISPIDEFLLWNVEWETTVVETVNSQ